MSSRETLVHTTPANRTIPVAGAREINRDSVRSGERTRSRRPLGSARSIGKRVGSRTAEGDSPVPEGRCAVRLGEGYARGVLGRVRPRCTRKVRPGRTWHAVRPSSQGGGSAGDHPRSLSQGGGPIVHQYREGKVKRTPSRGVKETPASRGIPSVVLSRPPERAVEGTAYLLYHGSASPPAQRASAGRCRRSSRESGLHRPRAHRCAGGTRNRVLESWAGRRGGTTSWRTAPTSVAKGGEDLGLGVKGQSNSEIAGFPRKLWR